MSTWFMDDPGLARGGLLFLLFIVYSSFTKITNIYFYKISVIIEINLNFEKSIKKFPKIFGVAVTQGNTLIFIIGVVLTPAT